MKQFGNIEFLIMVIGSVVFFTLLLVTGNTMAISVRERTGELAILKAIGFGSQSSFSCWRNPCYCADRRSSRAWACAHWLFRRSPNAERIAPDSPVPINSCPRTRRRPGRRRISGLSPGSRSDAHARRRSISEGLTMAIPLIYNVRSVKARWTSAIVAVLGIAGTVGVFVAMLSLARGFPRDSGGVRVAGKRAGDARRFDLRDDGRRHAG